MALLAFVYASCSDAQPPKSFASSAVWQVRAAFYAIAVSTACFLKTVEAQVVGTDGSLGYNPMAHVASLARKRSRVSPPAEFTVASLSALVARHRRRQAARPPPK